MGIKVKKKAKVYVVNCSCCKKPINAVDVWWFKRVPFCEECKIKKTQKELYISKF